MTLSGLKEAEFDVGDTNHASAILAADFPEPLEELCSTLLCQEIKCEELVRERGGESQTRQRLRLAFSEKGWLRRNVVIRKMVDDRESEKSIYRIDHFRQHENGAIALDIQWNNKNLFFDRELKKFQRLHVEGVISVGVIVTRGSSLQNQLLDMVRRYAITNRVCGYEDLRRLGITTPTRRQQEIIERNVSRISEQELEQHIGAGSEYCFAEAWSAQFVADKFSAATTHWNKLQDSIGRGVGNPCPLLLIGIPASVVT